MEKDYIIKAKNSKEFNFIEEKYQLFKKFYEFSKGPDTQILLKIRGGGQPHLSISPSKESGNINHILSKGGHYNEEIKISGIEGRFSNISFFEPCRNCSIIVDGYQYIVYPTKKDFEFLKSNQE